VIAGLTEHISPLDGESPGYHVNNGLRHSVLEQGGIQRTHWRTRSWHWSDMEQYFPAHFTNFPDLILGWLESQVRLRRRLAL
jgi:hypothetical protein